MSTSSYAVDGKLIEHMNQKLTALLSMPTELPPRQSYGINGLHILIPDRTLADVEVAELGVPVGLADYTKEGDGSTQRDPESHVAAFFDYEDGGFGLRAVVVIRGFPLWSARRWAGGATESKIRHAIEEIESRGFRQDLAEE